jgi:FAD/FMN-containing dehydrogenase
MTTDGQLPEALTIIDPSHVEYETARATFNATIDKHPAFIVRCSTVEDVRAAVHLAQQQGLPVSIRGGGHSVAGLSVGEGAVLVDLIGMTDVGVDPVAQTALAGGGATWENYDTATQRFGLASTGGTFADTGIAGLTLGGGIGHLQGKLGFAIDNLIGARVVTAGGEVVRASADENEDLFWALRGGGGNFGIVTDFEYRLHPVTELFGGLLVFPPDAAAQVLRLVRDLAAEAPDELVLQYLLGTNREDDSEATVVSACYLGSHADGERAVEPLRKVARPIVDLLRPLSYADMQATFEILPFGLRHYWKGHFLKRLPDEAIDTSVEHFITRPKPSFSTLLFEFIGGAPTRVSPESMAFNQRDARCNASALGIWEEQAQDSGQVRWAREFASMLEPYSTGSSYTNYMSADEPTDRVRAAYGDEKFTRLREIKKRYDPDNVFRFNQNIPPAK